MYDETFEKGQMCYQSHKPGEKVEKGTIIYVKVSKGPAPQAKIMENLINQKQDIAKNYLTKQGILFLAQMENSDTVAEGNVIRTDPAAGEELKDGQTVILYISLGPAMERANVPSVLNQSLETAKTILNMQGVQIEIKVTEENSDTVAKGGIIRTEPAAGEEMKTAMSDFLQIMYDLEPNSIGGKLPGDDFYFIP